jgi:hypothetical protein
MMMKDAKNPKRLVEGSIDRAFQFEEILPYAQLTSPNGMPYTKANASKPHRLRLRVPRSLVALWWRLTISMTKLDASVPKLARIEK